jgi:hypothetical protein
MMWLSGVGLNVGLVSINDCGTSICALSLGNVTLTLLIKPLMFVLDIVDLDYA